MTASETMDESQQCRQFDVCIVGAGPGGLAALSAIKEPYSIDRLGRDQVNRAFRAKAPKQLSVCVVDPKPWLSSWRERFSNLGIKWLRSPALAHPDSFDSWSLVEFAHKRGRSAELYPTDPESLKSLKSLASVEAGLFHVPSSELFLDFCDAQVEKLPHTFISEAAVSLSGTDGNFAVELSDGTSVAAKVLVLALGVPGPAVVPPAFKGLPEEAAFHAFNGKRLSKLQKGQRVLVIGGGLTAAQAALYAVRKSCKVTLCSRRPLRTRSFDIPVEWFDHRTQGRLRHNFWQQSAEERLKLLRTTKGGGSVPPWYMQELKKAEAAGKLQLMCAEAEESSCSGGIVEVKLAGECKQFQHVILACGHMPDCTMLPLLSTLQQQSPASLVGGLPQVSKDLQWGSHQQLYLVGALAALQAGPDAANLMGCRQAAEIVAQSIGLRMWQRSSKGGADSSTSIRGNRFAALDDSTDSDSEDEGAESATDEESNGESRVSWESFAEQGKTTAASVDQ